MIRRARIATLLVAVLAALLPMSSGLAQDGGSIGIRLLDAPTDRRDDPRAHTYIVDHLNQGATITRHVEVTSTAPNDTVVQLYVAAATVEGGQFKFGDGRAENDLTDWSSVDPPSVTVPANGAVQATVTIAVPEDATDGERYAVIWVELPGSGGTANVVNRVGVRIYLSVGEGEEPVTDFTIDTLTARRGDDGEPIVETTVTNTGGRAIDIEGSLMLADRDSSLTAGPFKVEVGTTLAPGARAPAIAVLDPSLPDGPWDAEVTIKSGRLEKQASGTITFPSEPGATAPPVKADADAAGRKVALPIATLLLLLVIAGLVWFLWWRRRRREDEDEIEEQRRRQLVASG